MRLLIFMPFLLLWNSYSCKANDSYLPESGSPQILSAHKTISMEKETIKIKVLEKTIEADCWFVFKNNGPAANVRMGFPDDNGSLGSDGGTTGFLHFNSYVNGKWTQAQSFRQDGNYWKVKTVAFPANSTTIVRDKYTANIGAVIIDNSSTARMAAYTLHTGASWKGNIGRSVVEFTFDFQPRPVAASTSIIRGLTSKYLSGGKIVHRGPSKPTVADKTLRFVRTNWRPTEKDDIMLWFLPPPKKPVASKISSAEAMRNFIAAIRRKDKAAVLGMVSKTSGFDFYNSVWEQPKFESHTSYSELTKIFAGEKGYFVNGRIISDWYSFLFTAKKPDDDGSGGFYDIARQNHWKMWQQIGENKYSPPSVSQAYAGNRQVFVQWRQENGKWVIGQIGYPAS